MLCGDRSKKLIVEHDMDVYEYEQLGRGWVAQRRSVGGVGQ